MLPASWGLGTFAAPLAPGTVSGYPQAGSKPTGGTTSIPVTVNENSPATVIDLGAAFNAVSGLQHGDGLKLSILGNTNSALVKPSLSGAALSLTYSRGKCGTATITVCATDADGVSVKRTLVVTVRAPVAAAPVALSPTPARLPVVTAPK